MAKMTEFDYEVRGRKQLARNACAKKNGSKSKKCSLPSDHMTKKEWNERCGKLMSYNLKKPMKWNEFKSMPEDLRKEYLQMLFNIFGVSVNRLAKMFECHGNSIHYFIKNHCPGITALKNGEYMTDEQVSIWDKFVETGDMPEEKKTEEDPVVVEETEPETAESEAPVEEAKEEVQMPDEETISEPVKPKRARVSKAAVPKRITDKNNGNAADEKPSSKLREFSLIFEGSVDPLSIANSITAILGSGAAGRVEVRYAM